MFLAHPTLRYLNAPSGSKGKNAQLIARFPSLEHGRARWLPGDKTSDVIRRLSGVDVHILRAQCDLRGVGTRCRSCRPKLPASAA